MLRDLGLSFLLDPPPYIPIHLRAIFHTAARIITSKYKLGHVNLLLKPFGDFMLHLHCTHLISVLVNI